MADLNVMHRIFRTMAGDEIPKKARVWLDDCFNPLSPRSSTEKLAEAYEIINAMMNEQIVAAGPSLSNPPANPPQDKF